MTIAHRHRQDARQEPEDLIREARRRQHRRQIIVVLVVAAVLGSVAGVVAELGGRKAGQAGPAARTKPAAQVPPGATTMPPLVSGTDTNLLMWPVGPASFSSAGGPPARFEDLATGRIRQSAQPAIGAGDYQPLLAATGGWLVYVGNGTNAIRDDLRGRPRVLAKTPFFVPAADPGRVWLFRFKSGARGPIKAWTESIAGARPSRTVTLPAGDHLPAVRGTKAGLLLQTRHGMALWRPGKAPTPLPYAPNISSGFDATSRVVAYGSDCASHATNAKDTSYESNAGYYGCRMLRMFNVVTGKITSIPAPAGTVGWVPNGFGLVNAFSPQGTMLAAYAAVKPAGSGRVRLYVLSTSGATAPRLVPSSAAFLFARTAWSVRGGWLLYQGPGAHLLAYQPGTGMKEKSTTPCCRYTVMVSVPSGG